MAPGVSEPVGSVGEEASRLLHAAEEWWRGLGGSAGESTSDTAPEAAEPDHAPCQSCPFCLLLSALRSARPEVFEHLSAASVSLAAAVRAALATDRPPSADRPRRETTVERIDIS